MKLTVLTENTVSRRGLLAEHGLSVLVEAAGKRILFDTGQSGVYAHNASAMGVSLDGLDAVVLSHGHYDHCGGLAFFPEDIRLPPVFMGAGALAGKKILERKKNVYTDIGIPGRTRDFLSGAGRTKAGALPEIRVTETMTEIFPDIWLLNRIPKAVEFEGVDETFVTDEGGGLSPDLMLDEQLLCIRENRWLHVAAGCCHVGIISCLAYAKSRFPEASLGLVFAGMHLKNADSERLNQTIEAFGLLAPACLVPVHCTGTMAIAQMKLAFPKRCRLAEAGKVIDWEM